MLNLFLAWLRIVVLSKKDVHAAVHGKIQRKEGNQTYFCSWTHWIHLYYRLDIHHPMLLWLKYLSYRHGQMQKEAILFPAGALFWL